MWSELIAVLANSECILLLPGHIIVCLLHLANCSGESELKFVHTGYGALRCGIVRHVASFTPHRKAPHPAICLHSENATLASTPSSFLLPLITNQNVWRLMAQFLRVGFFTCRMPFLSPDQQCQSTERKIPSIDHKQRKSAHRSIQGGPKKWYLSYNVM